MTTTPHDWVWWGLVALSIANGGWNWYAWRSLKDRIDRLVAHQQRLADRHEALHQVAEHVKARQQFGIRGPVK